jgi:hypothetical protein
MNVMNNEETNCTYTKWKPEEDAKLIQEIAEKKTYEYIALEHKRTLIAIKCRTVSHIIYTEYKNGNRDIDNLSNKYNIEREMIDCYIEKNNKYDTILSLLESNIISIEKKLDSVMKIIQK